MAIVDSVSLTRVTDCINGKLNILRIYYNEVQAARALSDSTEKLTGVVLCLMRLVASGVDLIRTEERYLKPSRWLLLQIYKYFPSFAIPNN